MTSESHTSFKLNIPITLKNRLSEAAERSGRSLTAEINTRLQASLEIADNNGVEFTLDGIEAFILEIVANATQELEERVKDLENDLLNIERHNSM
ncbi:TraY domain-containing protein [Sulfitobacter sp. 1A13679]|uniref:TraY domain-containing protein n=1 Tax=Sulfitobacter sp. 1A13679 TaxID=3368597 RepID=UPI003746EF04